MKKFIAFTAMTVIMMAGLSQLSAQTLINNDTAHSNRAYLRAGIDPSTLVTVGYERKLGLTIIGKHLVTFAEWEFSVINLRNSEIKLGGILPLYERRNFKIVNNLNLSAGTLTAKHFDSKKFAIANEVAIGFYKPKWFFSFTAEYEKIYLNHIEHSDFYSETYYEEAVDGWYTGAGGGFQFGIEGGYTFLDRYDVHLEFKMPFTEKFNFYGGSPAHVNLGFAFRF